MWPNGQWCWYILYLFISDYQFLDKTKTCYSESINDTHFLSLSDLKAMHIYVFKFQVRRIVQWAMGMWRAIDHRSVNRIISPFNKIYIDNSSAHIWHHVHDNYYYILLLRYWKLCEYEKRFMKE